MLFVRPGPPTRSSKKERERSVVPGVAIRQRAVQEREEGEIGVNERRSERKRKRERERERVARAGPRQSGRSVGQPRCLCISITSSLIDLTVRTSPNFSLWIFLYYTQLNKLQVYGTYGSFPILMTTQHPVLVLVPSEGGGTTTLSSA